MDNWRYEWCFFWTWQTQMAVSIASNATSYGTFVRDLGDVNHDWSDKKVAPSSFPFLPTDFSLQITQIWREDWKKRGREFTGIDDPSGTQDHDVWSRPPHCLTRKQLNWCDDIITSYFRSWALGAIVCHFERTKREKWKMWLAVQLTTILTAQS